MKEGIEAGLLFFRPGFKNAKSDNAKHLSVGTVDRICRSRRTLLQEAHTRDDHA